MRMGHERLDEAGSIRSIVNTTEIGKTEVQKTFASRKVMHGKIASKTEQGPFSHRNLACIYNPGCYRRFGSRINSSKEKPTLSVFKRTNKT
jgi:hypothetical protein